MNFKSITSSDIIIHQRFGLSKEEIMQFCQQWGITEMSLFGSILTDKFHKDSDIDILIRFDSQTRQGLLTLAKIKHELEAKTGRMIDIVVKESIENSENSIRRLEILTTAQVIYVKR